MVILWYLLSEAEDLQVSAALLSPQQFDPSPPAASLAVACFRAGGWQLPAMCHWTQKHEAGLDLAVGQPSGVQR